MDDEAQAATPDAGAHKVAKWLAAIAAASREEENWRKEAEKASKLFRGDRKTGSAGKRFNILYSNIETLVPALYNTAPVPDIRRRFGDVSDTIGKIAADALERVLSEQCDAGAMDAALAADTHDAALVGRGVLRVRYEVAMDDEGMVADQVVRPEHVPWDNFRRGMARAWRDVPWVAFKHMLRRSQVVKTFGEEMAQLLRYDAADPDAPADLRDSPALRRAEIWEVWCKETRTQLFVSSGMPDQPLKEEADPLGLEDFFPCPEPAMMIRTPGNLIPVVPYELYRDQAEELDRLTMRITSLTAAIKWRGLYMDAGEGVGDAMAALEKAKDGELVPATNAQALLDGGSLDKAIFLMPIEKAVQALQALVEQRDRVKQVIYEIMGLSDILRGVSEASETATAQSIKAQWGGLRIDSGRKEIQRLARDTIRIMSEIVAEKFGPEIFRMAGVNFVVPMPGQPGQPPVPQDMTQQVMGLLRSERTRQMRVDVETDSTIRADMGRAQKEFSDFLTGVGVLTQAVGPIVQADPAMRPVFVALLKQGAQMFRLGRQVQDALEALPDQPPPPAPDPAVEAEKMRAQAEQDKAKMDLEATRAKTEATVIQSQAKTQEAQAKHGMAMEALAAKSMMPAPLPEGVQA